MQQPRMEPVWCCDLGTSITSKASGDAPRWAWRPWCGCSRTQNVTRSPGRSRARPQAALVRIASRAPVGPMRPSLRILPQAGGALVEGSSSAGGSITEPWNFWMQRMPSACG